MSILRVLCLIICAVAPWYLAGAAQEMPASENPAVPAVDFSYAFAPPHRMTVARPDCSDKTLLDLEPGALRMGWTYDNLLDVPVAAYVTPQAVWGVRITPRIGGETFSKSTWTRFEGDLPVLDNRYEHDWGVLRLEVAGGATAAVARVIMTNSSGADLVFSLSCESQRGFFGYNPSYVDPVLDRDCLLAGWGDRADRIIVLAVGADTFTPGSAVTLCPTWNVRPGETRIGWLVRPYRGYTSDLPALRASNWDQELAEAKKEWRALLDRTVRVEIPDPKVATAFRACIGDLFIMREPVAGGYIASTPGTDGYRAGSSGEAAIVAVALDQLGLHKEAAGGFQMCLDQQGDDGNWADPKGWAHLMWCIIGFKAWTVQEHFRLTGDRDYLATAYPRLLASSRWQARQRARTRVDENGAPALTYGLMPRGMGDCGLKDGDDLYGVYLPHNMWSVFADRVTLESAEILGKTEDIGELRTIYESARKDLVNALDRGAIQADGYRWIPGVPGKTSGSRWGALNALFPCGILPRDHELVAGTLRHLRSNMSPGGLPLNTGWMPDGLWVAIALDNLAEVHLVRGEGDEASELLYATLNHGTPLLTWCEERGQEPGTAATSGDRQHLWTPVSVVRAVRDMLVMEDGVELHLALGTHRAWLISGRVGIHDAPTHFGRVSYEMAYDVAARRIRGSVRFPEAGARGPIPLERVVLHLRLPRGLRVAAVTPESHAQLLVEEPALLWTSPEGEHSFEVAVE